VEALTDSFASRLFSIEKRLFPSAGFTLWGSSPRDEMTSLAAYYTKNPTAGKRLA
jgi:hypothetical protein